MCEQSRKLPAPMRSARLNANNNKERMTWSPRRIPSYLPSRVCSMIEINHEHTTFRQSFDHPATLNSPKQFTFNKCLFHNSPGFRLGRSFLNSLIIGGIQYQKSLSN